MKKALLVCRAGLSDYSRMWELQKTLHKQRLKGTIGDVLILCEHPHTYTVGRDGLSTLPGHLLLGDEEMKRRGITLYAIDRGGDITYHGPGQIVGYPILDLNGFYRDVHRYLRDIEEVIIRTLAEWGIHGKRIDKITGVWVDTSAGPRKICAIGVKVSRWITMHGFAFNVNTDLDYFSGIIPCGITDKGVTSLHQLTGRKWNVADAETAVINHFCGVFGTAALSTGLNDLTAGGVL